ncbi:MAG: hypothetical protein M1825_005114 [Sarcosagium campestre]|nr:MAG: hypothetical protein M1825_005114 [Sarcosagium campestre]
MALMPLIYLALFFLPVNGAAYNLQSRNNCRKAKVAVLGAGVAGITAAQALSNNSVEDFVIVEYNSEIGGRCRHAEFGNDSHGKPYTIELGANWIQGTVTEGGPENPIWTLVKKYKIVNHFSNLSSLITYDPSGPVDYKAKLDEFETAYAEVEQDAGYILSENLQDRSFRSGLRLADYKPGGDAQAQAMEWYEMDFEYAQMPDVSSQEFTVGNYNSTFYGFSEVNNFVTDQRGYNTFIHGEASTFLRPNDTRLLLNTIVTNITWGPSGVTIDNEDGSCIEADYAICTFSVGVLQSDAITFSPELPRWKKIAIETFQLGIYTKIFMQFPPDKIFWDKNTQFLLYASKDRGYYPVYQPLDIADFLPGSGILVATVVTDQSLRIEEQDDETTKQELLVVLRQMFGEDAVPEPIDFMYPRWGKTPWARGSYSNWPPGLTLEGHQNLRANNERLWYAGEATSPEFYGYLHGAYFEGKYVGESIAACLNGSNDCAPERYYDVLTGTTNISEYSKVNGWFQSSFQTIGDVGLEGDGG